MFFSKRFSSRIGWTDDGIVVSYIRSGARLFLSSWLAFRRLIFLRGPVRWHLFGTQSGYNAVTVD